MEIRFEIDTDNLTVADMLLIEDAQDNKRPFHSMTDLLARHMVDGAGNKLDSGAALAALKSLSMADFLKTAKTFGEAIQRKAVPPVTNGD